MKNPFRLYTTPWMSWTPCFEGSSMMVRLKYPQWAHKLLIIDTTEWPKPILFILAKAIKLNGGGWEYTNRDENLLSSSFHRAW